MKPGAAFYIWLADTKRFSFEKALRNAGMTNRQCLVWVKNQAILGRQDYHWAHEPCLYGWAGAEEPLYGWEHETGLYGWKDGAAHNWEGDRKRTTVLCFDKPVTSREHPTMKPVPLFEYLMKNSSRKGDTVLDLFAGSGTTMIAAEQNGRKALCMECDPRYVDVIIDRWELLTGKDAELIERAETDG